MLAQSFKTAQELEIREEQFSALVTTLKLFEVGDLVWTKVDNAEPGGTPRYSHKFNMRKWAKTYHDCGTVACIGGTAEMITGVAFGELTQGLRPLFFPYEVRDWDQITVEIAGQAIRNYLTHGRPMWEKLVPEIYINPKWVRTK